MPRYIPTRLDNNLTIYDLKELTNLNFFLPIRSKIIIDEMDTIISIIIRYPLISEY